MGFCCARRGAVAASSCIGPSASGITGLPTPLSSDSGELPQVPTLFRFLVFVAVIAGLIFGGMVALVTFVQPVQREMIEIVPPAKLQPKNP